MIDENESSKLLNKGLLKDNEKPKLDAEAVFVYQRGFAVIDNQANQKKIGTAGLGPCIATVMYDPDHKILAITHIDAETELASSIATVMAWMKYAGADNNENLNITILGGDPSTQDLRTRIKILYESWKLHNINDLNPESRWGDPVRFVVNVEDGKIEEGIMPAYPEEPLKRTAKLARTQNPGERSLSLDYTDVKGKAQGLD